MNSKTTMVTLVANGVTEDFEFSHAERILNWPNHGGWKLPDNSKYEFKDNALHVRGDKKKGSGK